MTIKAYVIGTDTKESLSPLIFNYWFKKRNINAKYSFKAIKLKNFDDEMDLILKEENLCGFNVTIPYKQAVIPFLDDLDESAQTISAVNCVYNRKGYNTDWIGFTQAMEMNDIQLKDKHCSILGAGGAARAVAYSLIKAGVKSIFIQNRTQEHADKLIKWINSIYPDNSSYETAEVIINCTPLGMWPDTESMPNIKIDSEQVLADTIYNPLETAWLNTGKALGAKTIGGLDMFIAQGLASADIWFGEKISKIIKLEPIKKVLQTELC